MEAYITIFQSGFYKHHLEHIKYLLDDVILYQYKPTIFVDIAFQLTLSVSNAAEGRNNRKDSMNMLRYDPCTPDYFLLKLKFLCEKHPQYFKPEDFEVKNIKPALY